MLKIQFKDRRKPALWLVDSTLKIGSDPSCDIVVNEPSVDPQHVELIVSQDDILLRNISTKRSVFINEFPVVKEQHLAAWDVIRLGNSELEIIDPLKERPATLQPKIGQATVVRPSLSPWMLKAISAPLAGQYFPLNHGNVIGRDDNADVIVPLSFISRRHAQVAIRSEKLYIEDLGSSNGTFVNGEKIKSCELRNGDELKLDEFVFSVIGPVTKVDSKPRVVVKDKVTQVKDVPPPKKNTQPIQPQSILASKRVFFHGLSGDVAGKVFEITNRENHISRMLGHHLSTSEKSVSARHVYLSEKDFGWEIKNDGAADGLMINGKMQARAVLQDGDEITVGGTLLKFQGVGDQPLNYARQGKAKSSPKNLLVLIVVISAAIVGLYLAGVFK